MTRYRFGSSSKSHAIATAGVLPARRAADRQTVLETGFPHVLLAIQSMWGYPELNAYFRKLTMDDRGKREGFPPEVWEDIHQLWALHQIIVPEPFSISCV